ILEIEGLENAIEAAKLEKLTPVERARSAAPVETRIEIRDRRVLAMPHTQPAVLPPCLSKSGLLARLAGIAEEDLAGYGEHIRIAESFEQWREEIRLDPHIAVEEHDHVVARFAESRVRSAAKSEIGGQRQHADRGECRAYKVGAAIRRTVVDHDHLVRRIARKGLDHRGKIAFE